MTMTANQTASTLVAMANLLVEVAATMKLLVALEKVTTTNIVAMDAASTMKLVSVMTVQSPASESDDIAVNQAAMMVLQAEVRRHMANFCYDVIAA